MTSDKASWGCLPTEIQSLILEALLQVGGSLASFATVSREWQTIIERHNFARIKLTPSRLTDLGSMISRNRALVGYIWFCIEIQEYDCTRCAPPVVKGVIDEDNSLIVTALESLFSALSTWEPHEDLVLDISVYSPSDSEHWFKYLTFVPDLPSDECGRVREQAMSANLDDHNHGWTAGIRDTPPKVAIDEMFDDIMCTAPFETDNQETRWWQQLPLIPAVTSLLLRQQTRRRWNPSTLAQMFSRFPRLEEIHYEPWREWMGGFQNYTDKFYKTLFESLGPISLRKLVIFENFNEQYTSSDKCHADWHRRCEPFRTPSPALSQSVANISLKLEHLSASFMVDASYFFKAFKPSWTWPTLKSLVLTSQLLKPDGISTEIDNMLQNAAAAAVTMPKLELMEIWNGRDGLAALFRYKGTGGGQSAVITWRGTWDLALQPSVIRAWEAVTLAHGGGGSTVVTEVLEVGTVIKNHGDAIYHLQLSKDVIRPVSLEQVRVEHTFRQGLYNI